MKKALTEGLFIWPWWDSEPTSKWVRHIGRTADVHSRRLPEGRGTWRCRVSSHPLRQMKKALTEGLFCLAVVGFRTHVAVGSAHRQDSRCATPWAARRARHMEVPSVIPPSPPNEKGPHRGPFLFGRGGIQNPRRSGFDTSAGQPMCTAVGCPKGEAHGGAECHPTLSAK